MSFDALLSRCPFSDSDWLTAKVHFSTSRFCKNSYCFDLWRQEVTKIKLVRAGQCDLTSVLGGKVVPGKSLCLVHRLKNACSPNMSRQEITRKNVTEFRPRSSLRETTRDFSVRVNLAVKPRPGQPPAANEMKPSPWRPPIRVFALVDAWPRETHQAQGRNVLTLSSNLRHVLLVEWRKRLKKWVELLCHVSTDRVYYQSVPAGMLGLRLPTPIILLV